MTEVSTHRRCKHLRPSFIPLTAATCHSSLKLMKDSLTLGLTEHTPCDTAFIVLMHYYRGPSHVSMGHEESVYTALVSQ